MTKHPSLTCMIEGGHSTMAPSEKMITNSESITIVGGFNPLEKYYCSQIGSSPPGRGENFKRKWNHHLDNIPNLGLFVDFRGSRWRIAATKRARGETPELWLPRRSRASPSPYPKQNGQMVIGVIALPLEHPKMVGIWALIWQLGHRIGCPAALGHS